MNEQYSDFADKIEFWNIKSVTGDEEVKNKVVKKLKEKVRKLYNEITKK